MTIHELIASVAAGALPGRALDEMQRYATGRRGPKHDHSKDDAQPTIVLDLNGTLTPTVAFDQRGIDPPFPGVGDALTRLAGGGACLHIATALLDPSAGEDVLKSRRAQIKAWVRAHGLPISYITGKVHADIYYDDRMIALVRGDWSSAMAEASRRIDARFSRDANGIWQRRTLPESGRKIVLPDPAKIAPDRPRGLVAPIIDIDMHRCLSDASSSTRDAVPRPGAVAAVRKLYEAGFVIHISCAGWDPCTHEPDEAEHRLAGIRRWLQKNGVPWDEVVSKDHGDIVIDDRGMTHTEWHKDLPVLMRKLMAARRARQHAAPAAKYGHLERLAPPAGARPHV